MDLQRHSKQSHIITNKQLSCRKETAQYLENVIIHVNYNEHLRILISPYKMQMCTMHIALYTLPIKQSFPFLPWMTFNDPEQIMSLLQRLCEL